jgi:hypothetical protein
VTGKSASTSSPGSSSSLPVCSHLTITDSSLRPWIRSSCLPETLANAPARSSRLCGQYPRAWYLSSVTLLIVVKNVAEGDDKDPLKNAEDLIKEKADNIKGALGADGA